LINLLVQQTNLYAEQKGTRKWYEVDSQEMRGFIEMLMAMGIHRLPSFTHYFSTDPFFRVQHVSDVMPQKMIFSTSWKSACQRQHDGSSSW